MNNVFLLYATRIMLNVKIRSSLYKTADQQTHLTRLSIKLVFSRVHATLNPALSDGPLVRPSVGLSVGPSVTLSFFVIQCQLLGQFK